jgi:hypothetical protein
MKSLQILVNAHDESKLCDSDNEIGGVSRLGHTNGSSHGESRIYRFAYEEVIGLQSPQNSVPNSIDHERARPCN